ncbi:enterobactin synthase subunit EntD [Kosakonia sp. BK9b]
MHTLHSPFSLAGYTLHRIDFDPTTFTAADLLWLPHHAGLMHCGRKRQAEHLAGRVAAAHALRDVGIIAVPAPGAQRQPCWPQGLYGSISHRDNRAIAVVAQHPVGVDIEALFSRGLCAELAEHIVNADEQQVLARSGLPFPLALTLAFSAKESLYKAFSHQCLPLPGFTSAAIVAVERSQLTLRILAEFSPQLADRQVIVHWQADQSDVMTLAVG